jgi:hypothetical protein
VKADITPLEEQLSMPALLENPGDTFEGQGLLLQHGRSIAPVAYHLAIPGQLHFAVNPPTGVKVNYAAYVSGFVLVPQAIAAAIELAHYTLELADKSRMQIIVTRRYKAVDYQGKPHVSFWVSVQV